MVVTDDVSNGLGEVLGREHRTELVLKGLDANAGTLRIRRHPCRTKIRCPGVGA